MCCKLGLASCFLTGGIATTALEGSPKLAIGLMGAGAALGYSGVKDIAGDSASTYPTRPSSPLLVPQRSPVKRRSNAEGRRVGQQELGKVFV